MFDKLTWFIAYRYFSSKYENNIISFITAISIIGVTLGTAILIIVIAVMNGFKNHIDQKLLQRQPHIIVDLHDSSKINDYFDIIKNLSVKLGNKTDSYALINKNAIIKHGANIIPVNIISDYNSNNQLKTNSLLINPYLADSLNLEIKDKIILASPVLKDSMLGPTPRFKRFIINNYINKINKDEYPKYLLDTNILISYDDAIKFFNLNDNYITGLYLYLANPLEADEFKYLLDKEFAKNNLIIKSSTWREYNETLFRAIKLERVSIILLLVIIVAVAGFNLISGLYIQVSEKRKNIAILRTYGLSKKKISYIFIIQGTLVGIIGAIFGLIFGLVISYNIDMIFSGLQNINILNTNNIFINSIIDHTIKITPTLTDSIFISIVALIICCIATIIPAIRANKITPIEALRNE